MFTPATNDPAPPYNGYQTGSVSATFTGNTTNGGAFITGASSVTGLVAGMFVVGTSIPIGTVITSVVGSQVNLSQVCVSNNTGITVEAYNSTTIPNLTSTMLDLPVLGAEIDLTLPREISRNFMESQPDPRKAQEVMPGAVAGSVNALIMRRQQRISEEADRLTRQYTRVRGW
jgi:hypothetical protein